MALPDASPKDGSNKKTANSQQDGQDKDFDPSAEALIHEIDDERTLEEEEAMNANNEKAVQEELDDLKKESEMPIEELLAYYERMRSQAPGEGEDDEEEEEDSDEEEDDDDDDEDKDGDDEEDDEDDEEDDDERRRRQEPPSKRKRGAGEESKHDVRQAESAGGSSSSAAAPQQQDDNKDTSTKNVDQQQNSDAPPTTQLTESHQTTSSSSQQHNHPTTTTQMEAEYSTQQQCKPTSTPPPASQHNNSSQQKQVGSTPAKTQETDTNEQETSRTSPNANHHQNQPKQTRQSLTNYFIEADEGSSMFNSLFADLDDSDSVDEDYSYTDDENDDDRDLRRVIHIGPDYQAIIPDGLTDYEDFPPYENEDMLVWKCCPELTQEKLLDYLKTGSSLSKKNEFSVSPGSVPKFSHESMRLYNERLHDSVVNIAPQPDNKNNNGTSTILLIPDVYMSQSRKRARIDYELEQENAIDGMDQNVENRIVLSSREDNSDSTSQETKPELSTEDYFYDEEQLLFLLLQCNHKIEEALRRRKIHPFKFYLHEPMTIWSQEECLGFEHGLRLYGKNFRSIRDMKVPTRTYVEVVAFYYLWKKSERHDVYTNRYKLDRKKCLSHPGTTDYMDKFIEDNESNLNATSSTPTPTDSTVEPSTNVDVAGDINLTVPHCMGTKAPAIHFISLSADTIGQNHHIQLHQSQKAETCVEDK